MVSTVTIVSMLDVVRLKSHRCFALWTFPNLFTMRSINQAFVRQSVTDHNLTLRVHAMLYVGQTGGTVRPGHLTVQTRCDEHFKL